MSASDPLSLESATSRTTILHSWRFWAVAGVLALLAWFLFARSTGKQGSANPAGRPIPVSVAAARRGDMAVNLSGLGTVTALNTVLVKSRVDGQLVKVHFTEGQMVNQGDLLAEIDPRPFQVQLMQAEGQFAKDQATFRNAQADLKRLEGLVQQGIVSRQQLDTQSTTVAQAEASLQADQAQVESAKLNLTYSRITAPIAGRVGLRMVDAGNMVRTSDAGGLVTLAPIQPIHVSFALPADRIQEVLKGMSGKTPMKVEAWDRDFQTRLALGTLVAVDNQVDATTGTVRMKALFANDDRALFPNQFVNARLLVDTLRDTVIIPSAAIQRGLQGAFVYVAKADGTADMRAIDIQGTEGEETAISRGLNPGDAVIIEGMEKLRPGSKVALPKPSPKG
ncbi:MAG TPA: MdtA/MuxA family multidrug efflux RND transporter periplasmic adaptor subunit [Geothrix sp.]|nr:MdtA/MuxA family multidrug efflux RND transporter periplasmic adaptor subunit [Geothrix sp.]